MVHVISVVPDQDGWTVRSQLFENAMIFKSGAKAEKAARDLGNRFARSGESSEICVYLRDGALAGRYVIPASAWGPVEHFHPAGPAAQP